MPDHPFLAEEFHIRWSQLIPEKVEGDIEAGIGEAQKSIDEICAIPRAVSYTHLTLPTIYSV